MRTRNAEELRNWIETLKHREEQAIRNIKEAEYAHDRIREQLSMAEVEQAKEFCKECGEAVSFRNCCYMGHM